MAIAAIAGVLIAVLIALPLRGAAVWFFFLFG
jgi:hypothetical protein